VEGLVAESLPICPSIQVSVGVCISHVVVLIVVIIDITVPGVGHQEWESIR
jgi:hypothetical protein